MITGWKLKRLGFNFEKYLRYALFLFLFFYVFPDFNDARVLFQVNESQSS